MYETSRIILAKPRQWDYERRMDPSTAPRTDLLIDPPVSQDSVYLRLRQDVLSGRLPANERLKVSTLAERYQTSTNPVREALQQLRGEGLVVIHPNRGARVREVGEDFVRDIYEIETLIEPYLTRWFVGVCTDADLAALDDIQAEIERLNFSDLERHSDLDTRFHRVMYGRHYNRHAVDLWWSHREFLRAINVGHAMSLRRQRDVVDEHRALIAALRAHDEDAAARIITQHVAGSGRHIIDRLRTKGLPPD
jgi:DNA-binding GntR family transcriptional regulator